MNAVDNLSTRTKLFGGFGLVLAISLVLGIVLIAEMGTVNAGGARIAANSLPSIEVIAQIQTDEQAYRADQLWNIANNETAPSTAPIDGLRAVDAQIQAGFQLYRSMVGDAADARLLAIARRQWGAYVRATSSLSLTSSNATQGPVIALVNSSALTFSHLAPTIATWVKLKDTLARSEANDDTSTYSWVRILGIALLAIALIAGAAAGHLIARTVRHGTDEPEGPTEAIPTDAFDEEVASGPDDRAEVDLLGNALLEAVNGLRTVLAQVNHPPAEEPAADELDPVTEPALSAVDVAPEALICACEPPLDVPDPIAELAARSEHAGQIAQTITAIVAQTNLLALNAAIETNRASERSHGSAVSAEEVHMLSLEAHWAAREISALIESIERDPSVHDMAERVEQITAASQQISAGARSIRVSATGEETSAAVDEIAASASELAGSAEALNALVTSFRV